MTSDFSAQVVDHVVDAPFTHSTGPALSRFLTALRDERRFWGRRCDPCERVVVPPDEHCDTCSAPLGAWEVVGPQGTVTGSTVVHQPAPLTGLTPPFAVLRVRLDGADTDLIHVAPDPSGIARGVRVAPAWAAQPTGSIRDVTGFHPAPPPADDDVPGTGSGLESGSEAAGTSAEPVSVLERQMDLPFRQTLGPLMTRFQQDVREGRLNGTRCSVCEQVYLPPRPLCPRCWARCEGWVPVEDHGTVTSYVVINVPFYGQEIAIPYVLAHIRLDGADGTIPHLLGVPGEDGQLVLPPEGVRRGMRVTASWRDADARQGFLNDDIDHFEPADEPDVPIDDLPM